MSYERITGYQEGYDDGYRVGYQDGVAEANQTIADLEAEIEEQIDIVHCKDCKNWTYPVKLVGFNKSENIGMCRLTSWLCGEQGFCMYGREVQ